MSCPHWKELLMVYCDALPVKKLIPADRVVPGGQCACGESFEKCPLFLEALAKLKQASTDEPAPTPSEPKAEHKERQ